MGKERNKAVGSPHNARVISLSRELTEKPLEDLFKEGVEFINPAQLVEEVVEMRIFRFDFLICLTSSEFK